MVHISFLSKSCVPFDETARWAIICFFFSKLLFSIRMITFLYQIPIESDDRMGD